MSDMGIVYKFRDISDPSVHDKLVLKSCARPGVHKSRCRHNRFDSSFGAYESVEVP